jgi:O-antigen/teichoic acid export membrane protein
MSWPMGVYMLVFISYDRAVDSMMIRAFLDEAAVANYGLAYKIYSNLITPAYFLASAVFPIMSRNQEKDITKKSLWLALLMVLAIVPIIFVLAPWIINVLAGPGFESAVGVLRILLIALAFAYMSHIVGFRLISKEGQREMLWLGLISLITNIILNVIFIPRAGIIAAAAVTAWTEAFMFGLTVFWLKKR